MNELKKLPQIIRQCRTIGEIPTSYKVSLTYEEQLMWFCKFLEEEVIPVVNNNSKVVQELKTYVEEYFNNLDVQEEINNKLEEMAESGELTDIIAQYLQLAGLLCFNTKSDMKNAENLSNGSFAKTLGTTTYNDGYGAIYKIRTILNTDVVDDINIIALTNYNNLVAELIPNTNVGIIQDEIDLMNENQIICIGDSYGAGYTPDGNVDSWVDKFKEYINYDNNNFHSNCYGGTGFYATADDKNFLTLLQELSASISNKQKIKKIYVLGGYNDQVYTLAQIGSGFNNFMTYAKTTYPNATIYVGCIGYDSRVTQSGTREALYSKAIPIYKNANIKGGVYLNNIEYILHNPIFMSSDSIHPNADGQIKIAKYLVSNFYGTDFDSIELSLTGGKIPTTQYIVTNSSAGNNSEIKIGKEVNNNITKYAIEGYLEFSPNVSTSGGTGKIKISNLQTITNNKLNQFQITTGTLNNVVVTRTVVNGNMQSIPAVLGFDGTDLNLLYYNAISDISSIFIPYQEFEVPSILC